MKTIVIIGGMGPQASLHAQKRLQEKLHKANKLANIVNVTLEVKPFHSDTPYLELSDEQRTLLYGINADVGFIACNTAHHFFDIFQACVKFKLEHLVNNCPIPNGAIVLCSQTSRDLQLFGNVSYVNLEEMRVLSSIISSVNKFEKHVSLQAVTEIHNETLVFGCTELSLVAFQENLEGIDTLEVTIDKIVNEL